MHAGAANSIPWKKYRVIRLIGRLLRSKSSLIAYAILIGMSFQDNRKAVDRRLGKSLESCAEVVSDRADDRRRVIELGSASALASLFWEGAHDEKGDRRICSRSRNDADDGGLRPGSARPQAEHSRRHKRSPGHGAYPGSGAGVEVIKSGQPFE
jgi:hypothetical protein